MRKIDEITQRTKREKQSQNNSILQDISKLDTNKINLKLKEDYNSIYNNLKKISEEKEQALESLRRETVINEEQRNYIEILKQCIESTIAKFNLSPILQAHRYLLINI